MSLPPEVVARCHGNKRAYRTKAWARKMARRTSAAFGGEPKVAYRCPVCDMWHVGRDPR